MIRKKTKKDNKVLQLFNELILVWSSYLSDEVKAGAAQKRSFIHKSIVISIEFIFEYDIQSKKKFVEYESSGENLFPGTLKYYKTSNGINHIVLFHCESINDVKEILFKLQFTSSYQSMMLKYVS